MSTTKVPVTSRALVQRINRKLKVEDEEVRRMRGTRPDFGDYYRVNVRVNGVVDKSVELAELGRELGVLKEWERVED